MTDTNSMSGQPQRTGIYAALLAFQQEIGIVAKSAENPFFHSSYAPLPDIIKTVQPVLANHGLGITQFPSTVDGKPALRTILFHTSGETIEDTTPIVLSKADPQAQGSAITYMRRYGYAAVTQIVIDEDDDGNKASGDPQFHQAYIEDATPPQRIKQEHLSGAITDQPINEQILTELNFLPNNLKLPKDQAKQIWDQFWQKGIRRGKFDPNTKKWSGTEISMSHVPIIVSAFGVAAGKTPDSIDAMTKQILGDEQVDTPHYEEGEEPF